MAENPLKVIAADNNTKKAEKISGRKSNRLEKQAYFDRLWLVDPEPMNPLRNCMERVRLERTMQLIKEHIDVKGKSVVDLGCGEGEMSRRLRDAGASVDAVDISGNALKKLKESGMENIQAIQDYAPMTALRDDSYDIVLCTELIGDVPQEEHRMLISELARIVKKDGYVVCSTSLDINSEDALQMFGSLIETEFVVKKWLFSYFLCQIRLKDFFEAPSRFARGAEDQEFRLREVNERFGFSRWWFRLNSTKGLGVLWQLMQYPCRPFVYLFKQNPGVMRLLERFCHFLWNESGITNAICIAQRRPLFYEPPANQIPRETKHKKQVWE